VFSKPPTDWKNLSWDERYTYLQQLSDEISTRDGRTPMTILHGNGQDNPNLRSDYDRQSQSTSINHNLVGLEEPYAAIEALFHESTHARQYDMLEHSPELDQAPTQLQDFHNNNRAYQPATGNEYLYRMQPLEVDARQTARAEMEHMFGNQNNAAYTAHRAARDAYNYERDQDGIDYVNSQPQFASYTGTAHEKVNQYIAEQARNMPEQPKAHDAKNTAPSQPSNSRDTPSQEHDETQSQRATQGRRRL
jgi:hypothetical protein